MFEIAEFPRRHLRRSALRAGTAWLALASLAAWGLPALAVAPDGGLGSPARPAIGLVEAFAADVSGLGVAKSVLRIAQAAPPAAKAAQANVRPVASGDSLPLPTDLVSQARVTQSYVIVTKAPPWLQLSAAQPVGDGVWLVSPQDAEAARMIVAGGASGEREIVLTIVDKNGAPVSEARLKLQVARNASLAAPATAGTAVAAGANVAAAPVTAPQATADTQTAAAPATTSSAKTWTDFIAGQKPAGPAAPAAKPAPATAAGGQKPEAELVGLAKHLVRECTTCHSLYGEDNGIPLMIGLTKDRFLDTMDLYKIGKRDNPAMQSVAQSLNDEETLALATYLARIKPPTQTAAVSAGVTSDASSAQAMRLPAARLEAGTAEAARIDRWVNRAREMLDRGDIAQARLLLQRGAERGHAMATMALASTYDPNILPWRPEMGPAAEPARARSLYQQAIQLGAGGEAERRLLELP